MGLRAGTGFNIGDPGVRFAFQLFGTKEALQGWKRVTKKVAEQQYEALTAILVMLVAEARKPASAGGGNYRDRTKKLRRSINWQIFETGRGPVGVFYAGMQYAVFVEYKRGYWVLSGAFERLKPEMLKTIKEKLQVRLVYPTWAYTRDWQRGRVRGTKYA